MTKMKTRKMTKSTFAIVIMGIAMVAMLAFGGTFAYFTATTAPKSSHATTGIIKLNVNSIGEFIADVVSGEEIFQEDQEVVVTDASNRGSWIFVTFKAELKSYDESTQTYSDIAGAQLATGVTNASDDAVIEAACNAEGKYFLKYRMADGWTQLTGVALTGSASVQITNVYYKEVTDATVQDEDTPYGATHAYTVCDSIKFFGNSQSHWDAEANSGAGALVTGSLMGAAIKLTVTSESIQHSGLNTAALAYKALKGDAVTDYVAPAQEPSGD